MLSILRTLCTLLEVENMKKEDVIREIKEYPAIYFDDLILALAKYIGRETVKRWINYVPGINKVKD